MIKRCKSQVPLNASLSTLNAWTSFVGIQLDHVTIADTPGKGSGIIATENSAESHDRLIVVVPRDVVLSLQYVHLQAKSDEKLRALLAALGVSGKTTRGAILAFLLQQSTYLTLQSLGRGREVGLGSEWANYSRFLPLNILPTDWDLSTPLLNGTTLKPALEAKLKALEQEFGQFKEATQSVPWCARYWWGLDASSPEVADTLLAFDDWLQVDFLYRSRGLEFPGIGDCLVPCLDMANHSGGDVANAYYECDAGGNAALLLRDGTTLSKGEEVTISYGDYKGACEMLFSYGFVPDDMLDAKVMFLGLDIDDDDPLAQAKRHVSKAAPGFRISSTDQINGAGDDVQWEGDFIWSTVVNEEDGLEFRVLQSTDGSRELKTFWKEEELEDIDAMLMDRLHSDDKWDVFQLRAVVTMQQRVQAQSEVLGDAERDDARHWPGENRTLLLLRLRHLERALLSKADRMFEQMKDNLLESAIVQKYLENQSSSVHAAAEVPNERSPPPSAAGEEEDFS